MPTPAQERTAPQPHAAPPARRAEIEAALYGARTHLVAARRLILTPYGDRMDAGDLDRVATYAAAVAAFAAQTYADARQRAAALAAAGTG